MRSLEPCLLSPPKRLEGINSETEMRLRSKKVKEWDSIYNILFPNDPVPSPCEKPLELALSNHLFYLWEIFVVTCAIRAP
jgi:hypothetical protein